MLQLKNMFKKQYHITTLKAHFGIKFQIFSIFSPLQNAAPWYVPLGADRPFRPSPPLWYATEQVTENES